MSRQVKAEAEHIFHNDNLFVLITITRMTPDPEHDITIQRVVKPYVLASCEVARSFKHYAITLDLDFTQSTSLMPQNRRLRTPICLMIAGEDVPWLVRALGVIDGIFEESGRPFLQHACLSISALGLFDGRSLDEHRLRKLLEPLHHLRGIQKACLNASMSAEYKHRIIESIQGPRISAEASVDKVTTFIMTGDEAFSCGSYLQAIYAYQEALDCLSFFYGLSVPWTVDGDLVRGIPTEIFIKLFNRQRAAKIRLEIGRKALEFAHSAQSGANRLDKSVRAGFVYAVEHFSKWGPPYMGWSSFECNPSISSSSYQYWRKRVGLDAQLGIIDGFESDPCMGKALRTLRLCINNGGFIHPYMDQLPFRLLDGWLLEI